MTTTLKRLLLTLSVLCVAVTVVMILHWATSNMAMSADARGLSFLALSAFLGWPVGGALILIWTVVE